jgi:hypothetical protein
MSILAIDPGSEQSAILQWNGEKICGFRILPNQGVLDMLECWTNVDNPFPTLILEMVACYGMPVGKEVFETVYWIGRFAQAWHPHKVRRVYRQEVKLHHCKSARAKDSNVRQALIDKYGDKGTKSKPGLTYGLKKDLWQAFAIATYATETQPEKDTA